MKITVNINGKATRIRNRADAEFWLNFCQNQADSWRRANADDSERGWNVDDNLKIQRMWEDDARLMASIVEDF